MTNAQRAGRIRQSVEDASDRHHREARAIQRWYLSHRPRLFTTHHILDESVTLIEVRLRRARAVRFTDEANGGGGPQMCTSAWMTLT